uniref:Frataxin n=1 Tax=Brassica campestris TaxID=3711 RepID=M4EZF2_BRACM
MATATRFLRRLPRSLKLPPTLLRSNVTRVLSSFAHKTNEPFESRIRHDSSIIIRSFSSQGPAPIDYSSILQEDEFHRLANVTINNLLVKIEDYGDNVQIDGFDIDYGMSSPVSGPSRFDWDRDANAWIYRRTEAKLHELLEEELENLCGEPIQLS